MKNYFLEVSMYKKSQILSWQSLALNIMVDVVINEHSIKKSLAIK